LLLFFRKEVLPPLPNLRGVIFAASVGNALEYYDFTVFGYFAQQIAAAFFPSADPSTGLLLTFGTYGVSFLARPFGAAILGSYADRHGRKASLTLTILLMTAGTLLMAVMPGYSTIGRFAAFGILAARLIQGFSAGGEFGSATAFMIEHAGARAGWFGSFQFTSQALSAIVGSGVAWAVNAALTQQQVGDWGFRIPFILGLLIGPVGWYIRRHVEETPAFADVTPHRAPARHLLTRYPGRVVLAAGVIAGGTAATYLNIYLPTYVHKHLHVAVSGSYAVTFWASVAPLFITPVAAIFSDRTSRLPIMLVGAAALGLGSYPLILLVIAHPTTSVLAGVFVAISTLRAAYTAPAPALLAEMFPVEIRGAGMSLGYTMGVVVFGGFAQLAMEWLIDVTGSLAVPGLYLAATSAISLTALILIARRVRLHL
jgi:MHS family proline/betaine transporter-like MFS transporter